MPTHRPAGQMRILRRDTWVPPYRVRRSRRTGRRDAAPYNGSPYPSAGGDAHIAPPDKCAFCGGTQGSRPTGYAGHAGRDVGTPSPTTAHRTHPQGAMPTHRPAGQMRILRRDTWVPPYRVRRSCRTGRRDAVPYNGSPHPSAGGDAHTSPRRTNAHFAAGHMGPALQGTPVMQDGTSRTPSPTTAHRTHPQGTMPTHCPAGSTKRQAQAPASLCVMRLFTWRSWRPHDRRGRPSGSAP